MNLGIQSVIILMIYLIFVHTYLLLLSDDLQLIGSVVRLLARVRFCEILRTEMQIVIG